MNYLAHSVLSFDHPDILVGNMINDFVKGKRKLLYPEGIQKGMELHRSIDKFTDEHAATREAKEYFRNPYRLYAGAFIDIVYDHFLANDGSQFESYGNLKSYTPVVYDLLDTQKENLPEPFLSMLPYMISQNWLYHYKETWGIEKSFGGLVRRATYLEESKLAFEIFHKYYKELSVLYEQFYPELKAHAYHEYNRLIGR